MPTLYSGLPKEEERARRLRLREERKESVRRHKPKVIAVEKNGEFMTIEWTRDNGERVTASFQFTGGWAKAPAAEYAKLHKAGVF